MPVERYTSIEDVPRDGKRVEDPREALRRMAAMTRFARSPNDPAFAPGVHKYRSFDEAQEARDAVEVARARARAAGGRPLEPTPPTP